MPSVTHDADATIAALLAVLADIWVLPLEGGSFLLIGGANGWPRVLNVAAGENWALGDGPNGPAGR